MTKRKILSLSFVFIFIFIFIPVNIVLAGSEDKINKIEIDVNILKDGDAQITETWNVYNDDEGTEWYKPMTNLNHIGFQDFSVKFNGQEGQSINHWDVNKSFEEKQGKYGIHNIDNGFEICWGKTKRGEITYEISYTYTNFVQKVKTNNNEDNNGIRNAFVAKLINDSMNPAPDYVTVRIRTEGVKFDDYNSEIYAFGTNKGEINFEDGDIIFKGNSFNKSNYLVVLVGTTEDLGAQYNSNKTYEQIKNTALKGSDYTKENDKNRPKGLKTIFLIIAQPAIIILAIISGISAAKRNSIRNMKEVDFELIPYNKESIIKNNSVQLIASLTNHIPKIPKLTLREILASQIIKWMNDGILEFNEAYYMGDNGYTVKITGKKPELIEENTLYYFIIGKLKDKIGIDISMQEFSKVFSSNSLTISSLLTSDLKEDYPEFIRKEDRENKEKRGMYLTEEGKDLVIDINGAYQFLKDFTLMEERQINELSLWEDYMVEAVLFKMPSKVIEELKKAAPEIVSPEGIDNRFRNYSNSMSAALYVSNSVSRKFYSSYQSATSRSSGGGGSSSSGSGGGSSGGGSGGGSR